MIDKQDFYHGAAVLKLIEDARCISIQKIGIGYRVNQLALAYVKYTTKTKSPWRFTFGLDELRVLNELATDYEEIVVALVCGGDGICAVTLIELFELVDVDGGWISAKRPFRQQYAVSGSRRDLNRKISVQRWPSLIFENKRTDNHVEETCLVPPQLEE
jgi:hypothetical protein